MDSIFLSLLSTANAYADEMKRIHRPTYEHSLRVARYCVEIAKVLNLGVASERILFLGGLLHDFGKLKVDKSILNKPTNLTEQEYTIMKNHSVLGSVYLNQHGMPESIVAMALLHHERLDGGGYPFNLSGKEIPLFVRILSVADSFDAMTSGRSYRTSSNVIDALLELSKKKHIYYDASVVDAMVIAYQKVFKSETISAGTKTNYA